MPIKTDVSLLDLYIIPGVVVGVQTADSSPKGHKRSEAISLVALRLHRRPATNIGGTPRNDPKSQFRELPGLIEKLQDLHDDLI